MNNTQHNILYQTNEMAKETFIDQGGWNSINLLQNNLLFSICVIAVILHFLIWTQLFIQKTKFDFSFIFSLSYISTDIFLLSSYFIQYAIRSRSWIPVTRFLCYFEAYSIFYFNLFESIALTALNICRYWQIVRNQNIYKFHRRKTLMIFIIVVLLVITNLIIQDVFGWCVVIEQTGTSCSLSYTNSVVRLWNLIVVLMIPIIVSFCMLVRAIYFLHNYHAHQGMVRRNHHSRLIIHTLIFYSIWTVLWLPWMIINYLDVNGINQWIVFVALLGNTLEIFMDPIIVFFLDKRFAYAWNKFYQWILRQFSMDRNGRVNPAVQIATIHSTNTRTHINR